MGWFDGVSEVGSSSSHKHHHSSSSKKHKSSSGSIFGGGDSHSKHNASRGSFFGGDNYKRNSSMASFFGFPNRSTSSHHSSSSSYYKRSPRHGYLSRIYRKLRRLLRDLLHYMKKHPLKVFMLVIMPLITGGALTTLLAKFGIRLPAGVERLFGAHFGGQGGYGVGVGRDGGGAMQWERTKVEGNGVGGALEGLGAVVGSMGGIGGAVSLAKMFM